MILNLVIRPCIVFLVLDIFNNYIKRGENPEKEDRLKISDKTQDLCSGRDRLFSNEVISSIITGGRSNENHDTSLRVEMGNPDSQKL